jgi:geranylgeranyl diphosphate synthase type I
MDLKSELKKRTDIFNIELRDYLKNGKPKTLYDAARHLPMAGGKRLRPAISMVSCEAVFGDIKKVIPLAISLELIHNFTLVHDDIMDKSNIRRNIPTVHKKYGEPTAIIAGDLLFAKSFEVIHNFTGESSVFKKLNYKIVEGIREVCEGQQLDMEFEMRNNVTETEYIEMIQKKTSALFMLAAEGGSIAGGGTTIEEKGLHNYGKYLGLAFQIRDDYLDMSSDENTLGKDIGNDVRNGKKTLIAVHSINNASGDDGILINQIFGNPKASQDQIKKVYNLFQDIGSIEYAKNLAYKYCDKAKQSIDILKDSESKEILIDLAEYSINREK